MVLRPLEAQCLRTKKSQENYIKCNQYQCHHSIVELLDPAGVTKTDPKSRYYADFLKKNRIISAKMFWSFQFFMIQFSVRLSDRSEVTQHKINFVKIAPTGV